MLRWASVASALIPWGTDVTTLLNARHRALVALASLCLTSAAPVAQFRQAVEVITIDALVVNERGEAVTDLAAGDFEVQVDGRPRRVVAFRRAARDEVTTAAPAGEPASSGPGVERTVVLLVQRNQIRPHEGRAFLDAAAAFIDTLDPADQVALWTMPAPSRQLEMPRDREPLKTAIKAIRGTAPPPHPTINLTSDEAVSIAFYRDEATRAEATTRECERHANPGPVCREEIETEAQRKYQEIRLRATETLQELELLIKLLSGIDGPKHVVFVTTGPPQTPDLAPALRRVSAAAARARVHIHALQIPLLDDPSRAETRGRPAPRVRQGNTAAYSLAAMTGGMSLTPLDPRSGFRRLRAELGGAYELGIEADPADRDGEPHRIEVRVTSRSGISVRARQQFTLLPRAVTKAIAPAEQPQQPEAVPVPEPVPGDPAPAAMLARLGDYIERFEKEFSSAVAEERYVQLIRPLRGSPRWPSDERALEWQDGNWTDYSRTGPIVQRRQLLSDVLLVHTPEGWLGYRDVATVDGRAVRQRTERVSKLFLSRDATRSDQLRRIAGESARYNIGGFTRTLNLPTLPLYFLRARNHPRFAFTSAGREQLDGVPADVIRYEERQRPTLIGSRAGEDVPISGRLWIDPATGEVVQTEIRVVAGESRTERRGTLVTRYRRNPSFKILIPDFMWEWYDAGGAAVGGSVVTYTIVEGLARYTNFRKFGVTTGESSRDRLPRLRQRP